MTDDKLLTPWHERCRGEQDIIPPFVWECSSTDEDYGIGLNLDDTLSMCAGGQEIPFFLLSPEQCEIILTVFKNYFYYEGWSDEQWELYKLIRKWMSQQED